MPNAEIAARLHLARGTVKNTVSALLRKLDEPDRTALALRLAGGALPRSSAGR
jgi:DNA-binding NarL/FixJ family response regulator